MGLVRIEDPQRRRHPVTRRNTPEHRRDRARHPGDVALRLRYPGLVAAGADRRAVDRRDGLFADDLERALSHDLPYVITPRRARIAPGDLQSRGCWWQWWPVATVRPGGRPGLPGVGLQPGIVLGIFRSAPTARGRSPACWPGWRSRCSYVVYPSFFGGAMAKRLVRNQPDPAACSACRLALRPSSRSAC